jgi:hypothetical protein
MNKKTAVVLGVFTYWPLIYVLIFTLTMLTGVFGVKQPSDGGVPMYFKILFACHLITMLEIVFLAVFYIGYLLKTDRVASNKKILWAVLIWFGNAIAMPIFWHRYIWGKLKASGLEQSMGRKNSTGFWVVAFVIVAFAGFFIYEFAKIWPRFAPFFDIYPAVSQTNPEFPGLELRVWIDGKEFNGDAASLIYDLQESLLSQKAAGAYRAMIDRDSGGKALSKRFSYWEINDKIMVTRSPSGHLVVQVDPQQFPKAKEFLTILEREIHSEWSTTISASIHTKNGMKPYRIEVISSGKKAEKEKLKFP